MDIHTRFDIAAALAAAAATIACFFWRLREAAARVERAGPAYAIALVAGAAAGGFAAGTANLRLAGEPGTARSLVGALAGAITAVELFKLARGIRGSTGVVFVPGFCASVAVGRWGYFFAGMDDRTHGTPATLPWAHDFGDGIPRHPVQLYESLAMAAFLAFALAMLARRDARFMRDGFFLMVLWYAGQRFLWEFLKPYPRVLGPLDLFHVICLGLLCYALFMLRGGDPRGFPPGGTGGATRP